MNNNKQNKKILMLIVFIILISFLFLILYVSKKVNVIPSYKAGVYGYWKLDTYEIYENNELMSHEENYKNLFINFSEDSIEFCYDDGDGDNCFSHSYEMSKKELIIYLFEEHKMETMFSYKVVDEKFILKDGDDNNYTLSTFSRM